MSDIRAAISNGDLGTGTVLESADVHATVADVADALEIYTGYDCLVLFLNWIMWLIHSN